MGTRHLIAVVADDEYKIAQYGQWDGYPSGQGVDILKFLHETNIVEFKNTLRNVRWITQEEWDDIIENHSDGGSIIFGSDHAKYWETQLKRFSRDTGSDILAMVRDGEATTLRNNISFAGDSLFCEYAYVIDLDNLTFEVYKGFNKEPVTHGRFLSSDESLTRTDGYEPVKLIKTYSLIDLPSNEQFLADLEPPDEDGEDEEDTVV